MLGTAQEDIDAIRGLEKSDFPIFVASNQRDDDDFSLFALEIIDSGHTEKIAQLLLLQRLSLVVLFHSSLVLGRILSSKPILNQGVLIPLAEDNLEVIAHCCT